MLKYKYGLAVFRRSSGASLEDPEPSPNRFAFERGTDMKYILILSILAALLGGCAIVPAGYGDHRDGYSYRERGYNRGDGNYRDRYYYQGDGNYRDYSYRR
jgi:hypothetical protein